MCSILCFVKILRLTKYQPVNTLGQARFGYVQLGSAITVNASISQRRFVLHAESVRFCSALFGLQGEWGLRRLANPWTTRHIFNEYLAETRRDESDP